MDELNLIDYEVSKKLQAMDIPFYALISAALSKADTNNLEKLKSGFPNVWSDLKQRHNAPLGVLKKDNFEFPHIISIKAKLIAAGYVARE